MTTEAYHPRAAVARHQRTQDYEFPAGRELNVRLLAGRRGALLESFIVATGGRGRRGRILGVPRGFVTDFASVPRLLWTLLPPWGRYTAAAVVHDWLYFAQVTTRAEADWVFLELMRRGGVAWCVRWAMYSGVRAGGWVAWGRHGNSARK